MGSPTLPTTQNLNPQWQAWAGKVGITAYRRSYPHFPSLDDDGTPRTTCLVVAIGPTLGRFAFAIRSMTKQFVLL